MPLLVETFQVLKKDVPPSDWSGFVMHHKTIALRNLWERLPENANLMPSSARGDEYRKEIHLYRSLRRGYQTMEVAINESDSESGTIFEYSIDYE